MSGLSINHFFPFRKVKLLSQVVNIENRKVEVIARPDKRFLPVCSHCGSCVNQFHSLFQRKIRDLNMGDYRVYITTDFQKVFCSKCGIRVQDLDFVDLWQSITKRLERYVVHLCSFMTISDVARHLNLDWELIKRVDKMYLKEAYDHVNTEDLRILAIDEISIKKGHRYLTVVINYETGEVIWMGEGRSEETLERFFKELPEDIRAGISAVAIDMWQPYINVLQRYCPHAKLVFDFFHVVSSFNKIIDKVRNQEYRKAI